jgi:uncharacterized phage protein (TIGR01671 family)
MNVVKKILFRGKRCDNGDWVQGFYVRADYHWHKNGIHKDWIICGASANGGWFALHNKYAVKEETIGQYTGLTDKNGKKIFEGDILDCKSGLYERCKVIYNEFCSAFQLECADGFSDFFLCSINHKGMEIIGNIYDNPELLKED